MGTFDFAILVRQYFEGVLFPILKPSIKKRNIKFRQFRILDFVLVAKRSERLKNFYVYTTKWEISAIWLA